MFERATDPPKPTVSRGLLCLRLAALGIVAALVLATSAGASVSSEQAPAVESSEGAPASGGGSSAGESGGTGGAASGGGEGIGETPAGELPPVAEPPPPVELPPVAEPPPAVELPPIQPPVESPAPPLLEQAQEGAPVIPQGEEQQSFGNAEESAKVVVLTPLSADAGTPAGTTTEGSAVVIAPAGPQPPAPTTPSEGGPPSETITISAAAAARGRSAEPGERLSCELSALGGPLIGNCAAGWLATPGTEARASSSSALGGPSLAAAGSGGSPGGNAESPAVNNRPLAPASGGSAPGGAAGGVAAGGAGGLGLSAFLTIAGLLLLAAPHAMRRLRLSCLPWRTAFFVLIPERPG
jgi:hypothetical protein